MKTIVFIAVLFVVIPSVSANASETVQGTWEWYRTTYSDGSVDTTESSGYTFQLQLEADGTFYRCRDRVPYEQSTWYFSMAWVRSGDSWAHAELLSTDVGDNWQVFSTLPGVMLELWNLDSVSGERMLFFVTTPVATESSSWGSVKMLYR